jgi:hypothetical protein
VAGNGECGIRNAEWGKAKRRSGSRDRCTARGWKARVTLKICHHIPGVPHGEAKLVSFVWAIRGVHREIAELPSDASDRIRRVLFNFVRAEWRDWVGK